MLEAIREESVRCFIGPSMTGNSGKKWRSNDSDGKRIEYGIFGVSLKVVIES
jgi:hypothetical protein